MLRARILGLLRDQRGDYVAQQMVGAIVTVMVMGVIATALVSATQLFQVIAERTAVTEQATSTGSALRSDITWASAIVPGDGQGQDAHRQVSFVIPGREARCQESTWFIRDTGGRRDLVNRVANYDGYDASTTPVTCTGARLVLTEQVMVEDIDPGAAFRYYNAGGRMFSDPQDGTFAPECGPGQVDGDGCQAQVPAGAKPRDLASKAVVSVELATTVGKNSRMAMPYRFRETATNLHKVPLRPADDSGQVGSFFQDHIVLGG